MTPPQPARAGRKEKFAAFIGAIRSGDAEKVEEAVVALSRLRPAYAPLAFLVGAFAMLFDGVKLLVLNWRLGIVEALPAMWVWLAMLDLRVHMFGGRGARTLKGAALIASVGLVALVTMAAFFLNGVFAFALAAPGPPLVRPAAAQARSSAVPLLGWGLLEGIGLGVATLVSGRWGKGWFVLATGSMIGVVMFSYVAIPSRILGLGASERSYSRRDRVIAAVIAGILGTLVCTPPYMLGRLGIALLGVQPLVVPAVILLVIGFGMQAGASGSVRAIKMSTKLARVAGGPHSSEPAGERRPRSPNGSGSSRAASRSGSGRHPGRGSTTGGPSIRSSAEVTPPR